MTNTHSRRPMGTSPPSSVVDDSSLLLEKSNPRPGPTAALGWTENGWHSSSGLANGGATPTAGHEVRGIRDAHRDLPCSSPALDKVTVAAVEAPAARQDPYRPRPLVRVRPEESIVRRRIFERCSVCRGKVVRAARGGLPWRGNRSPYALLRCGPLLNPLLNSAQPPSLHLELVATDDEAAQHRVLRRVGRRRHAGQLELSRPDPSIELLDLLLDLTPPAGHHVVRRQPSALLRVCIGTGAP